MDVTRVTAKTLDEAITKAAIDLGTSSDNLEYSIEEQKSGIFGLGKSVTIKAYKKSEGDLDDLYAAVVAGREEKKPAPKENKKEEPKVSAPKEEKKEPEKDYVKPAPRNEFKDQKKDGQKKEQPKKEKKDNKKEFKTEFKTESKYEVKSMKGREKPKQEEKEAPKNAQKPVQKETPAPKQQAPRESYRNNRNSYRESIEEEREALRLAEEKRAEKERDRKENRKPTNIDECQEAAKNFLVRVFEAMGTKVDVETVYDDEEVELTINLSGEDMGVLIGRRGQTLDSLQYLVSLVVNKQTDGYLRVKLDTENYRERRKETLELLAKNIAYKVRRTRHSVSLEPMNPYERRIIHATLQNDRYVVTRSEGEDPYRHVVISLKREAQRDRRGGYSRHNSQNNQSSQSSQEKADE